MRLASYLKDGATSYGIVTDRGIIDLASRLGDEAPTLKALIASEFAGAAELSDSAPDFGLDAVTLLPPIPEPGAIWCVGLNTHTHFHEAAERMGFKEVPQTPMFFLRAANTLVGSGSPIEKPALEPNFDYEGEIAVVIGRRCRNVSVADAPQHIAGFSCFNDGSARQYQIRSHQVTTGKNGYHRAGFGPWLVTADEIPPDRLSNDHLVLQTRVNGEIRQNMRLDDLIFSFADLISHISEVTWLEPGDVLVTGSAEGAGALRNPQLFLAQGDVVEVEIDGIGTLSNTVLEQAL
ncbi:MAG: fumarylacetoacetate hydrolase family protein [Pseudomonadota bacterium]